MLQEKIDETVEVIMGLFANFVPGNGMKFQALEAQATKRQIPRQQIINVTFLLLMNDYLDMPEDSRIANFVKLTDKGYAYIKGDEKLILEVNFAELIDWSHLPKEKIFYSLWDYIGDGTKDTNPFYVTGPQYYNLCKEFLPALPPTYSAYLSNLEKATGKKQSRSVWRKELLISIPEGDMKSFLERLSILVNGNVPTSLTADEDEMDLIIAGQQKDMCMAKPRIFVSHSSKDKPIIDAFVDNVLVMGLGLSKDNIVYTSHEVYGVEPGDDISRYIKDNIETASVVLLMISNGYQQSEVCLNEMGAAWALGKPFISVLLPNTGYDKLGWLTNLQKAIRIDQKEQVISLCQKIVNLLKTIEINDRLTAIVSYTDKFIGGLPAIPSKKSPSGVKSLQVGNIDDVVKRAIFELGEFTIKELQDATNIKDYRFLADKVNAMVVHGELVSIGDSAHRKFRLNNC